MAQNILMPALSPTMTEGKLAKWLKKEGDSVAAGDVIAEIETDKATMEFEAVDEGVIGKILVAEGTEGVLVNAPIAILLEEGDDASAAVAPVAASAPAAAPAAAAPASVPVSAAPVAAQPVPMGAYGTRLFASPLARRIAKNAGLDLTKVAGSGPRGRIVKHDVEAALAAGVGKAAPAAVAAPAAAPVAAAPAPAAAKPAPALKPMPWQSYTEHANTGMRKTIARRLAESKQTVPHFYLSVDIELDGLLALRKQLNDRPGADYKLSVNDFIIKACALALKKVPAANAMWTDEAILTFDDVDVSVAVATDAGLITPVIRNADRKGLSTISNEMKGLAKKARDGKLKPEEFQGGGFTISNLGMFGIKTFSAIINPPQSCILAVGAGEERVVVRDGAVAIRQMMTVTLSVDHRSVDGAVGAEFLSALKPLLEDPIQLML
ncbi:pyruvate dehydrogenase complex dihydrolipoamide acetyltransferase [Novispirillum itersonii]|uniref:Acetyltransferase component of pyruvate dehydrogenase complex n=1 Tax=Novispirillum itersonii TaxID=189 RepID=A0A7W9ZFE8_NOVIT|nr:pyruvate dehydrogenase complex dihydrolipoamide acetyltransferase [Novispirillum itersonii]MBB6210118.1 pyruvate dehydrogenase E2 component (dihydrolipoamide acetyltransferase) [Novispirillum itersonii]